MQENLLQPYQSEIARICRETQVSRLYVFGSVLTDQFNEQSDVDFLAEFEDREPSDYADAYFAFCEKLEALLSRKVDVTTMRSLKNPYFKQAVEAQRQLIYQRA